jgi:hypothetical protein
MNTTHERVCTTLDHVYPFTIFDGKPKKGTPCYCGERKWGVEHKPKPKVRRAVTREENPAHDSDSEAPVDTVPATEEAVTTQTKEDDSEPEPCDCLDCSINGEATH